MNTENDTDDDDRSSFEFYDAVGKMVPVLNTLATSLEPLRERILHAYIGGLSRIRSNSLPPGSLREELESLMEHLSSKPMENANEGRIHATLRAMSDHEAQEAAKRIIRFHYAIQEEVVRRECQRLER
jgi:Asp/Glu/hydantoin racemase